MQSFAGFVVLLAVVITAASACMHVKNAQDAATATATRESHYQFQKVVYQTSGGLPDERACFLRALRNIGAHVTAAEGSVETGLVDIPGGITAFQQAKTDPEHPKAIDAEREKKVRLPPCRNTTRAMSLALDDVYAVTEADIAPSGVAELARLQRLGFVYIHP